jgi:hypothetical protein
MPPPQPPQGAETERPNKPQRGLATWPQPHGESAKIAGVAIATQAAIIIANERNFMENPPRIELKLNEPVIYMTAHRYPVAINREAKLGSLARF